MSSPSPDIFDWAFWIKDSASVRDLLVSLVAVIGIPFLTWREFSTHRTAKAAVRQAEIANKQAETAAERHEKQTEADHERRITDNFTKAIELLGKPELEVRIGAIYALERIASESERDHWPIMETLTAYVRTKSPAQVKAQDAFRSDQSRSPDEAASAYAVALVEGTTDAAQGTEKDSSTQIGADIQAVLTVLAKRTIEHERLGEQCLDLSGANLSRANLHRANLSRINLRRANLSRANLMQAKLDWANLSRADLRNAVLSDADLSHAVLRGADLRGAYLSVSNLNWTNLRRANLSGAHLNGTDVPGNAIICKTIMPDGTVNNRDCPPESTPPEPHETPPAPN